MDARVCAVCGKPAVDPGTTVSTTAGMMHADCAARTDRPFRETTPLTERPETGNQTGPVRRLRETELRG